MSSHAFTNTKRINFYNDTTIIDYVDATDFIKDGMLNNVEVVTLTGETYLRFTFNTDAGKEAIDIKVSDFAALYEAGSGVSITNDNVINLKLANKGDSNYIKLDNDGLYLTGISAMAGEIQQLSAATTAMSSDLTQLSAATTGIATNLTALSAACVTMSGDINENRTDIDSLSASLIDDEFVIAAALNDLNRRVVEISGNTGGGGQANVQSDWDEADPTSDAYIKNKPTIGNAEISLMSDSATVIDSFTVNQTADKNINLGDTFYTKQEVDDLLASALSLRRVTTAQYNAMEQAGTLNPDTLYVLVD